MIPSFLLVVVIAALLGGTTTCWGFAPAAPSSSAAAATSTTTRASRLYAMQTPHDNNDSFVDSRRALFGKLAAATSAALIIGGGATAANAAADQPKATIFNTGKPPIVPGKKPKDPNDVSGTRKDPKFLRSIADCKNQCENTAGPDGLAKSKEECLSDCQDICCTTYEQCSFAIVPRI